MYSKKEIAELFNKFSSYNVLVIGDVMVDSYLWGKVERISPEAPVPIVSVNKREERLGGAANVALNIQSLGANPIIVSVIGKDRKGCDFLELMKKQKLDNKGIIISDKRKTTTKFRVLGNSVQMLRVDEETEDDITKEEQKKLIEKIKQITSKQKINAIIIEDYDKGLLNKDLIESIAKIGVSKNIPVCVDPKKKNFNHYSYITLFKPNMKELREGLNLDIEGNAFNGNKSAINKAMNYLHKQKNIRIVLLTLASEGIYFSEQLKNKKDSNIISAHKRNIADVSGAGDTVISVAALCLAAGLETYDIAKISNLSGGLVCEYVGVVPINPEQLKKEMSKNGNN